VSAACSSQSTGKSAGSSTSHASESSSTIVTARLSRVGLGHVRIKRSGAIRKHEPGEGRHTHDVGAVSNTVGGESDTVVIDHPEVLRGRQIGVGNDRPFEADATGVGNGRSDRCIEANFAHRHDTNPSFVGPCDDAGVVGDDPDGPVMGRGDHVLRHPHGDLTALSGIEGIGQTRLAVVERANRNQDD
jgi:hypothetical protein